MFNAGGGEIAQYNIPGEVRLIPAYWLTADTLVFTEGMPFNFEPYSVLLNTNTGDVVEIPNETFPDFHPWIEWIGTDWSSGYFTRSSISPDGQFIVYATYDSGFNQLVLWDLENGKEVARFDGLYNSTFPWWSSDGEFFLTTLDWEAYAGEYDRPYVGGDELVRINTMGEIERLTYLTSANDVSEYDYVWSPDGTEVAFWVEDNSSLSFGQLAVLEIESGTVATYGLRGMDPLVWSPDGNYLAVLASDLGEPTDWDVTDIFVVDLENASTYLVEENEPGVYGWMNYDQEAIGDNVYPTPEVTDLDTQIAELRASFEKVQPSARIITKFDIDLTVQEIKAYFESELDLNQLTYGYGTNETIILEDVRARRGVKNTYSISFKNLDYCINDLRIDRGGIHIVELETTKNAKIMTESFFTTIDFYRDRDPVIQEVPYGDWAGIMFAKSRERGCQKFGDQVYTYEVDMMVANYYINISLEFGDETSVADQREIVLNLAELIVNIFEENIWR